MKKRKTSPRNNPEKYTLWVPHLQKLNAVELRNYCRVEFGILAVGGFVFWCISCFSVGSYRNVSMVLSAMWAICSVLGLLSSLFISNEHLTKTMYLYFGVIILLCGFWFYYFSVGSKLAPANSIAFWIIALIPVVIQVILLIYRLPNKDSKFLKAVKEKKMNKSVFREVLLSFGTLMIIILSAKKLDINFFSVNAGKNPLLGFIGGCMVFSCCAVTVPYSIIKYKYEARHRTFPDEKQKRPKKKD